MADSLEMLINASSGATGGGVSKLFSYPLERVKSSLMAKKPEDSFMDVLRLVHSTGWFSGLGVKIAKTVTQKFTFFYFYEGFSQLTKHLTGKEGLGNAQRLLIGYFSEIFGIPFFSPLETVVVQMQTVNAGSTTMAVVKQLFESNGLAAFYGAMDGYMIGAIQPAIVFAVYERIKSYLLKDSATRATYCLSPAMAFWLGAMSRSIGLTIAHPINLGRTLVQSGSLKAEGRPVTSVLGAMLLVFKTEGVAGLFKGLFTDLIKGMLDAAVMMMVKERIHQAVREFYYRLAGRKPLKPMGNVNDKALTKPVPASTTAAGGAPDALNSNESQEKEL